MDVEHDQRRQAVVAHAHGDVDSSNAADLTRSLTDGETTNTVLLDLSDVQYLDSAGIAAIETLRTSTDLRIIAPQGSIVRRALEITGFDQLIPIVERLEDIPATPGGDQAASLD